MPALPVSALTPEPWGTVILGVAASDAHSVANQLIAASLRLAGFTVVNLGVCTPLEDFARAADEHPDALAIAVGSTNGHAYDDLCDLPALRRAGRLRCPVLLGGNLSVGQHKNEAYHVRLRRLGVDQIVSDIHELHDVLRELAASRSLNSVNSEL